MVWGGGGLLGVKFLSVIFHKKMTMQYLWSWLTEGLGFEFNFQYLFLIELTKKFPFLKEPKVLNTHVMDI